MANKKNTAAPAALVASPDLTSPFSWRDEAFEPFLERLQGNILKGHGREHTNNIFFRFAAGKTAEARAAVKLIATQFVTSALKQLKQTEMFKRAKDAGTEPKSDPFVSIVLSRSGYPALGAAASLPPDPKFRAGMRASADLNDPDPVDWDEGFQTEPDGMILVAADSPEEVEELSDRIFALTSDAIEVTHRQPGTATRNAKGEGIEHFGYVDGRSQPLFLIEDIAVEQTIGGTIMWDPAFSPARVVVHDPGAAADGHAFGSYFIFRKLEERVRAFKTAEQRLANDLGLKGDERERAGALCVGRFEDGTPATLSKDAVSPASGRVPNDFNYDHDDLAGKCPYHGHIRKSNPRGSALGNSTERLTIMARRGITYEDVPREVHPDDLPEAKDFAEFQAKVAPLLPEGDLGLLFMAYNVDIDQQFETTQRSWVNSATFPPPKAGSGVAAPGTDPVIGQPAAGTVGQKWPEDWVAGAAPLSNPIDFRGHVILKGGDYFFAPSLTFLKSL